MAEINVALNYDRLIKQICHEMNMSVMGGKLRVEFDRQQSTVENDVFICLAIRVDGKIIFKEEGLISLYTIKNTLAPALEQFDTQLYQRLLYSVFTMGITGGYKHMITQPAKG